jgi:hypothetical protein
MKFLAQKQTYLKPRGVACHHLYRKCMRQYESKLGQNNAYYILQLWPMFNRLHSLKTEIFVAPLYTCNKQACSHAWTTKTNGRI